MYKQNKIDFSTKYKFYGGLVMKSKEFTSIINFCELIKKYTQRNLSINDTDDEFFFVSLKMDKNINFYSAMFDFYDNDKKMFEIKIEEALDLTLDPQNEEKTLRQIVDNLYDLRRQNMV